MRTVLTSLLILATALAGCSDSGDDGTAPVNDTPASSVPKLHGWVFDEALAPLVGAQVEVLEAGMVTFTDDEGFYGFTQTLPANEPLIVVAKNDAFKPSSQQVTIPLENAVRLNFSLEAEPILVPELNVLDFDGFLNCQYNFDVGGSQNFNDCSGGTGGDIWDFAVGPNLAGVVLEIEWNPNSDLSRFLHAKLETQNMGDQTLILSEHTSDSVLRLQVAEQFAKKFYPSGGIMRLTVNVDPNNADQETEVGAAIAVSQPFKAFASLFYVEPPGSSYSIGG